MGATGAVTAVSSSVAGLYAPKQKPPAAPWDREEKRGARAQRRRDEEGKGGGWAEGRAGTGEEESEEKENRDEVNKGNKGRGDQRHVAERIGAFEVFLGRHNAPSVSTVRKQRMTVT